MGQQIYPAHTVFSLLGDGGRRGVPPPVENLLIQPHLENFPPTKSQFPPCPTKQQFSSYNLIKTAFLAVAIAPAPFLF